MAGIAGHRGPVLLMALHTSCHLGRPEQPHGGLRFHFPMTRSARHLPRRMLPMAEKHKVRQLIDPPRRNHPLGHFHMASRTSLPTRKPRPVPRRRPLVAKGTSQLHLRMPLMRKRGLGPKRPHSHRQQKPSPHKPTQLSAAPVPPATTTTPSQSPATPPQSPTPAYTQNCPPATPSTS